MRTKIFVSVLLFSSTAGSDLKVPEPSVILCTRTFSRGVLEGSMKASFDDRRREHRSDGYPRRVLHKWLAMYTSPPH